MEIDTAIMMVTFNRLDLTKKTIENLYRNNKRKCHFIIIDNGSTDGTVDYLNALNSNDVYSYHVHLLNENKGIASGRNIALKVADELGVKWYCTIDNDVDMPDGWLEECIDILSRNKAFGAVGVNMEDNKYPTVTKNGVTFQEKPAGNLGTACMVFTDKVHKAIGFFKKYNKYGLEDSDFGMRARFFGFKLGYILENGTHLGVGTYDTGDYRKWKTLEHDSKVAEFQRNCSLYVQKKLPIYIPYTENF